jgi:hypothetical protein
MGANDSEYILRTEWEKLLRNELREGFKYAYLGVRNLSIPDDLIHEIRSYM